MENFRYADIHCHPNLKTFGHSFDKRLNSKSDMWYRQLPTFLTEKIHQLTGLTKFSQTSFTNIAAANGKIVFLSLYPFEKGFFINPKIKPSIVAILANWAIEIGYRRIRYLQKHTDYFQDLQNEYQFVLDSQQQHSLDGITHRWQLTDSLQDVKTILEQENSIAVIITIEGAHVFNTGLGGFGKRLDEEEILSNVYKVKKWKYRPLFIGLAHNFNNDLCGHARSLQRLGNLVDQGENLNSGISKLGIKVIRALLNNSDGRSIYIDLKHMSLRSRGEYMQLLKTEYENRKIPLVVSHGSVTGLSIKGNTIDSGCYDIFNENDLNFYNEEIVAIAISNGLFALQMDIGNNADSNKLKRNMPKIANETPLRRSSRIIWNQLKHIALVLDNSGLFAWGTTAIGSDYDGSINPFPGILSAESFRLMANELVLLAEDFLKSNILRLDENKRLPAEQIIDLFLFGNTESFLKIHY